MAAIRMNQKRRDMLLAFADRNVECPKEKAAARKAYDKAAELVAKAVKKKFPVEDMEVLQKYDVAGKDRCIQGGDPDGRFIRFEFARDDERTPTVPQRYCSTRSISFDKTTVSAIDRAELVKETAKDALKEKLGMYKTLIVTARTYEEIVDAWPAAASIADEIGATATALVALSPEMISAIRADNAGAAAEEKEAA